MANILVVDDDAAFRDGLAETLADLGHRAVEAASGGAALSALRDGGGIACIFLDFRLPDLDGLAVLAQLRDDPALAAVPVVMLTAHATSDNTIEAMRLGAFDHLTKPIGRRDIAQLLERIVSANQPPARAPDDGGFAGEPSADRPRLLGVSAAMRDVQKQVGRAAMTDATVLVTGETGTGKEVAARVLHAASARHAGPFVAVNCAAIPADLLESELFGHRRGAFTGAHADRAGRLVEADGGTLFLDEIGDMPAAMQAKLLRALQEREVTPLGADRATAIDIRVVAATHRDLAAAVANGTFREDLFYRLNVIPLHLPPLADRVADILPLAAHFLGSAAGTRPLHLTNDAQRALLDHRWPGNVRELRNVMERAAALAPGPAVGAADLGLAVAPARQSGADTVPAHLLDMPLPDALATVERAAILHALERANGNRAEAARQLGIGRQSLYARMANLGIERDD
ncbi:TPA: sigma-54-dependent Fis family transcriptional regulator [Burkholderia aenigmatica]|uniref:sigma-54-dependent transcriptional regulator n=1 Tax=Burkholderia sp. AU45251 TaxID=3059204 RepID=UPI00264BA471|nr:sigma-54 dependent transcriptional regulator [Burkholderia sp. AU45251]HDR9483194.1 sigma-54-dependent Fis family transcriptional regulator [Burkholderia aenigmatica]MDN7516059.1 sigma-54 dependent transcriptional regulator [Burkholderia sp. AU45251]HDR9514142.1 sigma-54-dependent Fis family transcriptional regulator [Burkholderia aenigmatica]HDR9591532.1 sigma-54-dependent Fis family transcriptional regulator [Burkholderia aenigmatica]HDR9598624.1 sigma-54-dependent Fis family transcriptio